MRYRNAFIEKLRECPPDTEVSATTCHGRPYRFMTTQYDLVQDWDRMQLDWGSMQVELRSYKLEVEYLKRANQTLTNQLLNNEVPF